MELTDAVKARIAQLQELPWRDIQKAGKEVGLGEKLPEVEDWKDMAESIAIAEAETANQPVYKPEPSTPESSTPEPSAPEPHAIAADPQGLQSEAQLKARGISVAPNLVPWQLRAIAVFERDGVPHCKTCAQTLHGNADGSPICPIRFKACPRLVGTRR